MASLLQDSQHLKPRNVHVTLQENGIISPMYLIKEHFYSQAFPGTSVPGKSLGEMFI